MTRWFALPVVIAVAVVAFAGPDPLVPQEVLNSITNPEAPSLPKFMTEAERRLPLPEPTEPLAPPTGTVYCPAEYEPMEGLFMAWESYYDLITQMTVGITTANPPATAFIVVDSTSEQSSAASTLSSAGANMNYVEFIVRTTDTVWIRDYGPRYIFEDGVRAIVDHTYNRPRPNDNALNNYISTLWGEPHYDIPLTHGGGNFHLFSNGDAFMSELILTENSGLTEQDVIDLYADYQNLNLTILDAFPTYVDSTQHLDMWFMPVGDDSVVIGEYTFDPPRQITNQVAADLQAQGYTVYRTPGWTAGGTHYTYTNTVICNDQVFVPGFNNPTNDQIAVSVFQQALPNHTIHQLDCTSIIQAAGALHCIVMHVPAYELGPDPVVTVQAPDGGEVWTVGQNYDIEWVALDDVGVTSIDILLSTDGGAAYPQSVATGLANTGSYSWQVPALNSSQCRVKIIAYDGDGNTGEGVSAADFEITPFGPQVIYEWNMDTDPGWTTEDQWAWGQPTGGGGAYGNPDPTAGYTGDNVYGYNLNGDYQNNLPERHLTSTAIDCTGLGAVKLGFWRWLGVEQPSYDHAYLRVSADGSSWTTIWENDQTITDGTWAYHEYDISAIADDAPTVYLRWTMGSTDWGWQYCGWNIDDVQIIAIPSLTPGDLNCDGAINAADIDPFVLALTDPAGYAAAYPGCDRMNGDCNGDGLFNAADIDPFVAILTGS